MKITVEDLRAVSAEVTVEMAEAYLLKTGWELRTYSEWPKARTWQRGDASLLLWADQSATGLQRSIEAIAVYDGRQPSEVLSDIVGYPVGLDRATASVRRNSASAHVVEAREALAVAESALRAKPNDPDRKAAMGRAFVRAVEAETLLDVATKALEAAKAAEVRTPESAGRCAACDDPVPTDAKARGWSYGTYVDGDAVWLCPDCKPLE